MARVYISPEKRQSIVDRAGGRCEYCQSRADYATETFAVEHITPISLNGNNELDNLALACAGCNGYKLDKIEAADPTDSTVVPLYHPRQDHWHTHFTWNDDFREIIGITATGRATVAQLQMNRVGLINIRAVLCLIRKHPPEIAK